jgi:hypothetical protein
MHWGVLSLWLDNFLDLEAAVCYTRDGCNPRGGPEVDRGPVRVFRSFASLLGMDGGEGPTRRQHVTIWSSRSR